MQVPYYQLTDAIVIGADSNLPLDTSTVTASHSYVNSAGTSTFNYDWSSPDMQARGANTYGINVPVCFDSNYVRSTNVYGSIGAEGVPANSNTINAKYFGSYGHRQISVGSTSFSFSPTSLGFSFSLTPSYDEAPISDILRVK